MNADSSAGARSAPLDHAHRSAGLPVLAITATLLMIAYILAGLATLTMFPLIWSDEAWYTQSSWSFVEHGTLCR